MALAMMFSMIMATCLLGINNRCAGTAVTLSCLAEFRSLTNQYTIAKCPAGCRTSGSNVCGTRTYASGQICAAAIHDGKIIRSIGGVVAISRSAAISSYVGSTRYGVVSTSCNPATYSYTFTATTTSTAFYRRPADGSCGTSLTNNVNNCANIPNFCKNGATCTNGVNSFTCTCPYGYSGSQCEINMHDCQVDPCQNGGTCITKSGESKCSCVGLFTGPFCDLPMSACYAGVYNRSIVTNAQMTASTFWGAKHEPFQARLHNVISATSIGAWAQKVPKVGDWLQVDFLMPKRVMGVLTRGRPVKFNQWITRFKISYGNSPSAMTFIKDAANTPIIFPGNTDMTTTVVNRFPTPITARYFRLYSAGYHTYSSLQLEYFTC